ncbi:MAG: hypothetical protein JSV88_03190 [Candidatus Aminicenantes bacterium]|nr:MAG: hypothetical protein JSV88_03190 [Candidatus Aminicenantes bacterium]
MKNCLKITRLIIGLLVLLFILPGFSFPFPQQQDHKKIVEEVHVKWWQVPVFAVDKAGNPITDLEPEDIEIRLNDRLMPTFTLHKRSFSVTQKKKEKPGEVPTAKQLSLVKKKVVFLLFDLALSSDRSITRAKEMAQKIVMDAEEEVRFAVMTIDAFAGLVYIGEGSGKNKNELIKMIENEVKKKQNRRLVSPHEVMLQIIGRRGGKYASEDMPLFVESASKWYKRKNMGFFYAFETLYFFLNSIEDNKFIYFFSEGMSRSILTTDRTLGGARGMYNYYLERIGKYLSRCGAMLFVINTMGVVRSVGSIVSGEESLMYLARQSGGKYLEGTGKDIMEKIENMYSAYYEISFPDMPQLKGMTRKIHITCKRKGVKIHSLKSLEKRKHYTRMNPVEKDMLALNLVTSPQNTLMESKISAYNASINKTKKSKKQVTYTVALTPGYLYKPIDLYKIWITDNQGLLEVIKVEREALKPNKNKLKIQFQLEDKKQKEKDREKGPGESGEIKTYFVLVNGTTDPAQAYVHGLELYDEDPELVAAEKKRIATKQKQGKTISAEEMNHILQGAADYCERLKQSAFHFYCREKILETRKPLTNAERRDPHITEAAMKKGVVRALDEIRTKAFTHVKSYIFGYRLIKQGNKINEERDWIASTDNMKVNRDQVIQTNAFFAQKAIFAPLTLLDRTRQNMYDFQFVKFAEHNGRPAVVIEAVPKNPVETATIYGKIWIDTGDFSVMKIQADPESIRGYRQLKDLAKKLRTRLYLSLVSEFDEIRRGIRFPTKVSMMEKYKGGRIISGYRGPKGWERTLTEFTYTDYQFFDVQTDVTVH